MRSFGLGKLGRNLLLANSQADADNDLLAEDGSELLTEAADVIDTET